MHVEGTEQLWLSGDGYVFHIVNAIYDGLTSKLLHLDVVELSEVTEPLDQLGRDAAIELKQGNIHKYKCQMKRDRTMTKNLYAVCINVIHF